MEEDNLLELARQMLAVAGMVMEDYSAGLITTGRTRAEVAVQMGDLSSAADQLQKLARGVEALLALGSKLEL